MLTSKKITFVLSLFAILCKICFAEWGDGIFQVGEHYYHGQYSSDIKIVDNIKYLPNGYGIEIWDIAEPAEPQLLNTIPFPQPSAGTILIQDTLMIMGTLNSLILFNLSDPVEPELLSSIEGDYFEWIDPIFNNTHLLQVRFDEIVLIDETVAALSWGKRLTSIDISDLRNPQIVSDFTLENEQIYATGKILKLGESVLAMGMRQYGNSEMSIITYELTDGELELINESVFEGDVGPMSGIYDAILINDDLIIYTIMGETEILGIDLMDPERPRYLGHHEVEMQNMLFGPWLEVFGDWLVVYNPLSAGIVDLSNGFLDLSNLGSFALIREEEDRPFDLMGNLGLCDGLAVTTDNTYFKIFDISEADSVEEVFSNYDLEEFEHRKPAAAQMDYYNGVVFCGGSDNSSNAVSIRDPRNPEIVVEQFSQMPATVFVVEETERLYIYERRNLTVYDLSDPLEPELIGEIENEYQDWSYLLEIRGSIGVFLRGNQLTSMNMADPVNPEIINTTVLPYPPLNNRGEVVYLTAVLEENSLFLGGPGFGESAELFQYNIAPMLSVEEPGGAEFVDSLDLSVLVNDVNLVYSMQIEDEIPVLVTGQIDENGRAVIPDDKLIVFNEQFADFLSVTELPFAGRIEIEDETIYLMNPTKGIRIYDSFDEPGLTGWYDTPGLAQQLMLIDSLIVIADTWSLQLLQVAEPDGIEPAKKHMAVDFELVSLYPNPFNSHVSINFRISHPNSVYFSIYNVMGQSVWTGFVPGVEKRSHSVTIDLSAQGSGLYFLQALSGNNMTTRRMTLLK